MSARGQEPTNLDFVSIRALRDVARCQEFLKYGARDNMKPGMKLKSLDSLDVYMVHFEGRCYWIDYNFLPEISGNMLWI